MEIIKKQITELKNYEKNARLHSAEQIKEIADSITNFGFNDPIEIGEDNVIISGHARLAAAIQLGLTEVPCVIHKHMDAEHRKAYILAANRIAMSSSWDNLLLKEEFKDLLESDFDLALTGFTQDEIDDLLFEEVVNEGLTDPDSVPDVPSEPITKLGDVWILGNHRLMCSNSTDIVAVECLLNGAKIDMVYTDPPYGVKERTNRKSAGRGRLTENKDYDSIIGDDNNKTAINAFNLCITLNINILVFWGANYYAHSLPELSSWLIWDKRNGVLSDDNADCELAWTNTKKPARLFSHLWKGCIRASEKKETKVHPTQKPVALAEWVFQLLEAKKNVLDLFGGSGSTLIACEKTNRNCFMMEISAEYCDVIIKRWENFTGKKAILET